MIYFLTAAVLVAALGAWFDWRTGHIPNGLTLGAGAAALVVHPIVGLLAAGPSGALGSLLGAALGALACLCVPGVIFFLGGMGGGDVKLFAAIGALCGASDGFRAESYSLVVALVIAPAYLAHRGTLWRTLGQSIALLANPFRRAGARRSPPPEAMTWFRLGPAIFLGTAAMLIGSISEMFGRALRGP